MLPALLAGIGGIAAKGLEFIGDKYLSDRQNQQNVDLWREQQVYNSPKAQMSRLKEAGLNPHLVYGNGATAQMSSPPQVQRSHMPDLGNLGLPQIMMHAQIENIEAQNANIHAQNDVLKAQAQGQALDNWVKAREENILKQSDKYGYPVTHDDLPGTRLLLKLLGSSNLVGKVKSLGTTASGNIQKSIDKIGEKTRRFMPWVKSRRTVGGTW